MAVDPNFWLNASKVPKKAKPLARKKKLPSGPNPLSALIPTESHLATQQRNFRTNVQALNSYIEQGKITDQKQVEYELSQIKIPLDNAKKQAKFELDADAKRRKRDAKIEAENAPNLFEKIASKPIIRDFHPGDNIKKVGRGLKHVGDGLDKVTPDAITDPIVKEGVPWVFDKISRPAYGVQNAVLESNQKDRADGEYHKLRLDPKAHNPKFLGAAFMRGLKGDKKTTGADIIRDTAAHDNTTNWKDNKGNQAIFGFGGDVLFDPLSYVGVGVARNAAKGVTNASRVKNIANKERGVRAEADVVDNTIEDLRTQAEKKADDLLSAEGKLKWAQSKHQVVNDTSSGHLRRSEARRLKRAGQKVDDFDTVLESGNARKAIGLHNKRETRIKSLTGFNGAKKTAERNNKGVLPADFPKTEADWLAQTPDLKTSLGDAWSTHPVLKDHDPNEFFAGLKKSLWRDPEGHPEYAVHSRAYDAAETRLRGPKKNGKTVISESPTGGTAFDKTVTTASRDGEQGLYARQQDLRDAVNGNVNAKRAPNPSKKKELDFVTAEIKKVENDKKVARKAREDYEANAFNKGAQDLIANKRNYRNPAQAGHLTALQAEVARRLNPKKAVTEATDSIDADLVRRGRSKTEIAAAVKVENLLRKEQGLEPLSKQEIVDARFSRDATDEVRLKNEGEDFQGIHIPSNVKGTDAVLKDITPPKFQSETARVKAMKPGAKGSSPAPENFEPNITRGVRGGKKFVEGSDELIANGRRISDDYFAADLGKAGDNFDELLDGKNLESVQQAIDKELKKLRTPVGRLAQEKIDVPASLLDESGNLDRKKMFGNPDTKPFIVIDKANERAFVSKANVNAHLGYEATDAEIKFLQHIADEANRASSGLKSAERIRPVGAKANPVGLAGVTRTATPRLDAIRNSLHDSVDNIDEVKTLKGQDLRLTTGGNIKKTAAAIKTKATEDLRTEAQKAQDAVHEARIKGNNRELGIAKARVTRLRNQHAAIQKQIDDQMQEAIEAGTKVDGMIVEQTKLQQIMKGEHNGDRVGLTLRVLGNNMTSGMTTARVIAAGKHINDLPVINGISMPYRKLFKPMGAMAYPLRSIRSKGLNDTSQIIRMHYDAMNKAFKDLSEKEIQDAQRAYVSSGGKVTNDATAAIDKEMQALVPYLDGSKRLENGNVFGIDDMDKFLSETLMMDSKTATAWKQNPTASDLLGNLGSKLAKDKDRAARVIKEAGPQPSKVRQPKAYSKWMEETKESRRIQSLKTTTNPHEAIFNLRVAIEQAEGYSRFKQSIEDLFGVKRSADLMDGQKRRANAATHEVIKQLQAKGWKTAKGLDDVNPHIYPPEIHADIERLASIFDRRNIGKNAQLFDKITGMWKVGATLYNPGYYTRNLIGEVISGYLGGVTNPKYYAYSMKMTKYRRGVGEEHKPFMSHDVYGDMVRKDIPDGTEVMFKRPDGDITVAKGEALYQDEGNYTSFLNTEFTDASVRGVKGKGSKLTAGPRAVHEGLKSLGERGENFPRKAHFLHALENAPKHMNIKEAAEYASDQVRKYHFDYSDVTDFEKMIMMRAFPFYKWTRKAVPLMTEMLFVEPGKMNLYPKAMNAYSNASMSQEDYEDKLSQNRGFSPAYGKDTAPFIRNMGAFPLGKDAEGKQTFSRIATPQMDALGAAFGLQGTANLMANPLLKVPFEQLRGKDSRFGKTFTGPNHAIGDRLTAAAEALPVAKLIAKIANRSGKGDSAIKEKGAWMDETLASFLTGGTFVEENDPFFQYSSPAEYLKANPKKQTKGYKEMEQMQKFADPKTGQLDFTGYYTKYPDRKTPKMIEYEAQQKKYSVGDNGFNLRQWIIDHPEEYPDGWRSNSIGIVPKRQQQSPTYKYTK